MRGTLILALVLAPWLAGGSYGAEPPDVGRTAQSIDKLLASEYGADCWKRPAEDAVLLRRVFLDIIGQPPTPDDVLAYLADPRPDKAERIVEQLLADPAYGTNWARYWRDVMLARRSEPRAVLASRSLERFLADAFNEGRSWGAIAREFITARGDVRENGATAIILAQGGRPEGTVSELSRIFCGIQIQCAQCHDHPTDRWKREQFHQLAAFFPRVAVRPTRNAEQRSFLVTVTDFQFRRRRRPANNNRFRGTLEHRMPDLEHPNDPGTLMEPVFFVTGQSLKQGASDAERREALAEWMTSPDNPWFAKAYVNRMWMEWVGHGFYEPVDDMGPERDVRSPAVLELLARRFTESGYDPKWLVRVITRTRAYRQRSTALAGCGDCSPAIASPQRLRADQLFSAISVALDLDLDRLGPVRRPGVGPGRRGPRAAFANTFGYDPSDPREEITGSIAQALAVMNSRYLTNFLAAGNPRSVVARTLRDYPRDDAAAVDAIYLRFLSRLPTFNESRRAVRAMKTAGSRAEGLEDLAWALANSTEFLYRR